MWIDVRLSPEGGVAEGSDESVIATDARQEGGTPFRHLILTRYGARGRVRSGPRGVHRPLCRRSRAGDRAHRGRLPRDVSRLRTGDLGGVDAAAPHLRRGGKAGAFARAREPEPEPTVAALVSRPLSHRP